VTQPGGPVPTYPSDGVCATLQVTGPVARTVEDAALMLGAVSGPSPLAPFGQPVAGRGWVAAPRAGRAKGLRLAYCPDIAGIGIDPDVERVCHEAAGGLERAGATVEVIGLDLSFARPAFLALRGLWFVSWMYRRLDQLDRFGANVAGNIRSGLGTTTRALAAAEEVRGLLWRRCREPREQFDHLLTPCMAVRPFPVEQNYPD